MLLPGNIARMSRNRPSTASEETGGSHVEKMSRRPSPQGSSTATSVKVPNKVVKRYRAQVAPKPAPSLRQPSFSKSSPEQNGPCKPIIPKIVETPSSRNLSTKPIKPPSASPWDVTGRWRTTCKSIEDQWGEYNSPISGALSAIL